MQVAIIGAGISGLAATNLLKEKGIGAVVYESKAEPGGLIRCTTEKGNLFHRVGGHVFNTKNAQVNE
jgi:protoporphyrinogen oxidase